MCTTDNGTTQTWLRRKGLIGDFTGEDCGKCDQGSLRLVRDSSYKSDGHCWRCNNKTCNGKVSIRRGSWFDHSKLTMGQVTYFWVKELPNKTTEEECAISNKSIVDWYYFCREVCATIIEEKLEVWVRLLRLTNPNLVSVNTTRGRRVDGVWVFGGIDRRTRQCFLVTVEDRSEATLIPIIQKYIKPGTTIMSDCWKAYRKLEQLGYKHGTVNHSVEFVNSATGDHTQTIEST